VPATILSRCQTFHLRRVPQEQLRAHFAKICGAEAVAAEQEALAMVARAADGSVRDGLSLLDRALAEADPAVEIPAERVRAMLGLADRAETLDLFETTMKGEILPALNKVRDLYRDGADALTLLQDLLEATHWLTRLKLVPAAEGAAPSAEEARGRALADALAVPVLARGWQMMLKGLAEVQMAPQPIQALEMLLIRLAHVHDLPTPGEIVKQLSQGGGPATAPSGHGAPAPASVPPRANATAPGGRSGAPGAVARALSPIEAKAPEPAPVAIDSFEAAVTLFRDRKSKWHYSLQSQVRLVRFEPGRIEINVTPDAPREMAAEIGKLLSQWTGARWLIAVVAEAGQATLRETADAAFAAARERARRNPIVQAALAAFPGAEILAVRKAGAEPAAAAPAPAPPPDDAAAASDPGLDIEFEGYEPIPDEE
jgi:DNA polymerase-3 subunit gamma/tau